MDKRQPFGAEDLALQSHFPGKGLGFRASVLRITQNRIAQMGAVQPKLVGAPGNRTQFEFA